MLPWGVEGKKGQRKEGWKCTLVLFVSPSRHGYSLNSVPPSSSEGILCTLLCMGPFFCHLPPLGNDLCNLWSPHITHVHGAITWLLAASLHCPRQVLIPRGLPTRLGHCNVPLARPASLVSLPALRSHRAGRSLSPSRAGWPFPPPLFSRFD